MLPAIIFIYVCVVIWKLVPVVFRALEIRKQFKADVEIRRVDMARKRAEEAEKDVKKAEDEYQVHLKRVVESVGHGGRVQYPWVSGIRTTRDRTIGEDLVGECSISKKGLEALKKLYEEEGP